MTDHGTSWPLYPHEPIPLINLLLCLCPSISVYPVGSVLWRTLTDTERKFPPSQILICGFQGLKCSSICLNLHNLDAVRMNTVACLGDKTESASYTSRWESRQHRGNQISHQGPHQATCVVGEVDIVTFSLPVPYSSRGLPYTCQAAPFPMYSLISALSCSVVSLPYHVNLAGGWWEDVHCRWLWLVMPSTMTVMISATEIARLWDIFHVNITLNVVETH